MNLYQIKDIDGEELGLIETDAPSKDVQYYWTRVFDESSEMEPDEMLDLLCKWLENDNYKAERTWVEDITP